MKTLRHLTDHLLDFAESRMPIPTVVGWCVLVIAASFIAAYWMGIR
jgi:hypothetical protein